MSRGHHQHLWFFLLPAHFFIGSNVQVFSPNWPLSSRPQITHCLPIDIQLVCLTKSYNPQASVQRTTASPAFSNSTHFTCWTFFQHTELNIKLREKKIKKRFVISHLAGNNRSRWLTSQPASQPADVENSHLNIWLFMLRTNNIH